MRKVALGTLVLAGALAGWGCFDPGSSSNDATEQAPAKTPTDGTTTPPPATDGADAGSGGFMFPEAGLFDVKPGDADASQSSSCRSLQVPQDGGAALLDETVDEGATNLYCATVTGSSYRLEVYEEDLAPTQCSRVSLEVTAPDGKDVRTSSLDGRNSIFFFSAAPGVYRVKVTGRKPASPCAVSSYRVAYAIR